MSAQTNDNMFSAILSNNNGEDQNNFGQDIPGSIKNENDKDKLWIYKEVPETSVYKD